MNRGKNKLVAGLFAIFLGAFGVHHFYLGSVLAGVIEIVLCCGFSNIMGIVEGIMLLIMSDAEFDARYNQREPESMEFVFMKPKGIA